MRKLKLLFLSSAALAFAASGASAQTCLGLPSFEKGSVHLNMTGQFPEAATVYAIGLGAGRPNNMFANFGATQAKSDNEPGKQTSGFLEFGYQVPAGPLQLCPVAGGYLSKGPNDEAAGAKQSATGATAGLAGGVALRLGTFKLIPNVLAKYEFVRAKYEDASQPESEFDFKYGSVDLGMGLVFFDRVSIQPLVSIPVYASDDEKGKASFGIFASVSFPWKAQEN